MNIVIKGFIVGKVGEHDRAILALRIETNEKGLAEIEKNPLQTFVDFKRVTYCYYGVYREGRFAGLIEQGLNDVNTYEMDLILKNFQANNYYKVEF